MRNIWQSLAWKEWNEHKWKLVSILAVTGSLLGIAFLFGVLGAHDRYALQNSYEVAVMLGGIPMALFIGLSAAASERSHGTLSFLQSLPVPMWRAAIHKIGFALLTMVLPVIGTALGVVVLRVIFPWIGLERFTEIRSTLVDGQFAWMSRIIDVAVIATLTAGSLVIWASVLGNNRKDEVSAGALALVLMAIWWSVLIIGWLYFLKATTQPDTARLRAVGVASAPLGFFTVPEIAKLDQGCLLLGYIVAIMVHLSLIARYVIRFGRTDDYGNRSPREALNTLERSEFLAAPCRYAFTAIAWKQLRESSPIALAGLAAVVVISTCFCLATWYIDQKWVANAGEIYTNTAVVFGFFIALVAGIGVALQDLGSSLNTFWRSRPIQPDVWFWTKFVTALLVVFAAVYVPIGLFVLSGEESIKEVIKHPDAATIVASQATIFAAAVMMTCLVRHAVYAAILSIAVVYLGVLAVVGAWFAAGYLGLTPFDRIWSEPSNLQIIVGLIITFFVCVIIAWLAMRNDWGRQSRY